MPLSIEGTSCRLFGRGLRGGVLLCGRYTGAVEAPLVLGTGPVEDVKGVGMEERVGPVEGAILGVGFVTDGVQPAAPRALGRSRDNIDVVVTAMAL